MSENRCTIAATPDQVFAVLLDALSYASWVVGADRIRSVDPDWPAVGSKFHHTIGIGPAKTDDSTKIVAVDAPRRLVLEARLRPAGIAHVEFIVEPCEEGSSVTIEEHAIEGPATHLPDVVANAGLSIRNAETLRRLRKVVEERTTAPTAS